LASVVVGTEKNKRVTEEGARVRKWWLGVGRRGKKASKNNTHKST